MKLYKIDKLNRLYNDSEQADREVFAEMRSNILLVAGEHYTKITQRMATGLRSSSLKSEKQRLRLTKNHTHRASRLYKSHILDGAPGVAIKPQRETELQDQKDAELNESIFQDGKNRYKFKALWRDYASDFIDLGEVCVKMYWDEDAGDLMGYEPLVDEAGDPVLEQAMDETGNPILEPAVSPEGFEVMQPVLEPVPDMEKPVFSGDFKFERIYGFNLLRHVSTEDMRENECWIVRKMVDVDELKFKYRHDPELAEKIHESSEDTYVVFDANKSTYNKTKGQVMLREYFWPPSAEHPNGWYVMSTEAVVLEQGELPFGIFPILWKGFDQYQSTPRGRSILKIARPYQAEINRASSTMALQQITLGDDKVLYQAGTKLAPGALLPGVRGISFQGAAPQILQGRTGVQYLEYVNSQIDEMDRAMLLNMLDMEDRNAQIDPMTLLYRAASMKKRFKQYIEKWEEFLIDFVELYLKLAKEYLPDDRVIPAIGRREIVNLAEFRKTTPLNYRIILESQEDTVESKFGRQLSMQHILQYVGKQLDPKQLGKLLKALPFANEDDFVDDLTIDEDNARNDMLALERGEMPEANPYTDPNYMLRKLTARMKKPDFRFLDPQIQQMYHQYKNQYEVILAKQQQAIQAAKNDYIPVEGALVSVDMYVENKDDPEKQPKRARLPQRSLEWLMQALEQQGDSLEKLEGMNQQTLAEIAQRMVRGGQRQIPA